MEMTHLETACRASGMLPSALEDGVRRLHDHFASQANPTPELISQQLLTLRETAPHLFPRLSQPDAAGVPPGMPESVWKGMAPESKLTWAREHQPLPPVARRRAPLDVSAAQAAELARLTPEARLSTYRQWQAQAPRPDAS